MMIRLFPCRVTCATIRRLRSSTPHVSPRPLTSNCPVDYRYRSLTTDTSLDVGETTQFPTDKRYNVGFIGLGNMGLPMVLNLAKRDDLISSVLVYDTNRDACLVAQDQGFGKIRLVESIPEIMSTSMATDVIFTMLPSCEAVDRVMTKLQDGYVENELTKVLSDGKDLPASSIPVCLVDCSTVLPATSRKWNTFWRDSCNFLMIDAPVSGGVKGAADGTLTFMVGAKSGSASNPNVPDHLQEQALTEVIQPLLYSMGSNILWCGGPGSGAATKLCNNLALAAQMVGICEALNLGERLGVDPITLTNAMNVSTASCWSSKVNNPHPAVAANMELQYSVGETLPASHDYQGGFATNLMMKDLKLALAAAEDCGGVALPLTAAAKRLYQSASTKGLGKKDFGVMLAYLKTVHPG
jgi:3-hydroxyisobutyrate dehydrogenase-like beta-hydroxyacid dehydrogenase